MIPVTQAVEKATHYFLQLFPKYSNDMRLEEVEKTEDDQYWLVTLGYATAPPNSVAGLFAGREYKVVKLRASDGEPVSVKIRKP